MPDWDLGRLSVTARPVVRQWARCRPVDLFRLLLQTCLDAAFQRLDLITAEIIIDIETRDESYSARAEKVDESSRITVTLG